MGFDPVARVVAYHAAINDLDFSTIEAMFAPDAVYASGGLGGMVAGRERIIEGFRAYFDAYPDQVAVDSVIEALDGSRVRSEWSLTATHRQTGDKLIRAGEEIVSFDHLGKIISVEVTDRAL